MKPESPLLTTVSQLALYLIKLVAIWLFFRGHNEPGGGFVAGLLVVAAIALQGVAFGFRAAYSIFPLPFHRLLAIGLALALGSTLAPVMVGRPLLDVAAVKIPLPLFGELALSTALLFDLGVLFVVVGAAKAILLNIAEEKSADQRRPGEAERGARSGASQELGEGD